MAYIKGNMRDRIDGDLEKLIDNVRTFNEEQRDSVLDYIFTVMLAGSFDTESCLTYERKLGILEGCKLELFRRRIAPYLDKKMEENGDVLYKAFRIK